MFQDYLFYGTDTETRYAFRMCHASNIVQTARQKHNISVGSAKLLGDGLLAGILLSSLLSDEERVNLRIQLGSEFILATETTCQAETKGYIEFDPESLLPSSLDEGLNFMGDLLVRSVRSQRGTGKLFEGITQSMGSSLEDAFNDHLKQSFQFTAKARFQSWIDSNGNIHSFGVVFLELPNLAVQTSKELWHHVDNLPSMRQLFEQSDDPDFLAKAVCPHQIRAIKSINPQWSCTCSQQSIENMILGLGAQDINHLAEQGAPVEIRCHYCSQLYHILPERLAQIGEQKKHPN